MRQQLCPDVIAYAAAISAEACTSDWQRAVALLKDIVGFMLLSAVMCRIKPAPHAKKSTNLVQQINEINEGAGSRTQPGNVA